MQKTKSRGQCPSFPKKLPRRRNRDGSGKRTQRGGNYKRRWVAVADGQFLYRKKEDRRVKWIKEPENLKDAQLNPATVDGSSGFRANRRPISDFELKSQAAYIFSAQTMRLPRSHGWKPFNVTSNFARVPEALRRAQLHLHLLQGQSPC